MDMSLPWTGYLELCCNASGGSSLPMGRGLRIQLIAKRIGMSIARVDVLRLITVDCCYMLVHVYFRLLPLVLEANLFLDCGTIDAVMAHISAATAHCWPRSCIPIELYIDHLTLYILEKQTKK